MPKSNRLFITPMKNRKTFCCFKANFTNIKITYIHLYERPKMKNHLFLCFLLFFLTEYGFAQTYIKPIIGRDFTKLENTKSKIVTNNGISHTREYNMSIKGFKFNSTLVGLKIENQLSPKYSITSYIHELKNSKL